uniref:Uncharacterized protein n=1 Tax=Molossus molossus TaxID=27622 RepID=A0A7J8FS07_MOLMO|nr:hypothetical protein HJG59_008402 [Molossus molossus]
MLTRHYGDCFATYTNIESVFSCGAMGFRGVWPSPRHGVCPSTEHQCALKRGTIWQKCHLACCIQGSHSLRYCELCSHRLMQKQQAALVNWQVIKPLLSLGVLAEQWLKSPEFKVVGLIILAKVLLKICAMETACLHQPKYVPLAPWSEHNTAATCHQLCPGCLSSPVLAMSKGHRIEEVPELLLVVEVKVEGYKKAKEAVLLLEKLKAWTDNNRSMLLSTGELVGVK